MTTIRQSDNFVDLIHLAQPFEFQSPMPLDACVMRLERLASRGLQFKRFRRVTEVYVTRVEDTAYYFDVRIRHRNGNRPDYHTTVVASGSLRIDPETGDTVVRGAAKIHTLPLLAMMLTVILVPVLLIGLGLPSVFFSLWSGLLVFVGLHLYHNRQEILQMVKRALA